MSLLKIANLLSLLPFLYFIWKFVLILYNYFNKVNVIKNVIYLYFLVVSTFSAELLKILVPYPKSFFPYSMRPEGAKNCDYFSLNGLAKANTPGLPSGHMTTTTFVMVTYILENINSFKKIIVSLFFIIAMGWARIYKKCHNKTQVICGIILGTLYAFYLNRILNNTINDNQ